MTENAAKFQAELTRQYTELFKSDPEYAYAKARTTPEAMAAKMTLGLSTGEASKDGKGVKNACKTLDIPCTYKSIAQYLSGATTTGAPPT